MRAPSHVSQGLIPAPPLQPRPLRLLMEVLAAATPRLGPFHPAAPPVSAVHPGGARNIFGPAHTRSFRKTHEEEAYSRVIDRLFIGRCAATMRGVVRIRFQGHIPAGTVTAPRTSAAHSGFISPHHLPWRPPPPRKRSLGGSPESKQSSPR